MTMMDAALRERASKIRMLVLDVDGVLTDGKLFFDHAGNEMKAFHTRDGLGMKALQRSGIEVAVITGRKSEAVAHRMAQLGIEHVYQGREDKLNAFLHLLDATGLDPHQVCFAGDDWIDLPVLLRAGLAVSVADAEERVRESAHYITSRNGGDGAVREICNMILSAQGKDKEILDQILAS
ncbi:MAG: 3-deoxy-manno-octulosonate-8-phosphatase KdsC [Gammaproteobacteria bacterium]|nr:3-deoxy-manno-octulosonate-8-phosphatase KdsC [Gammaproteobacteria bacterium]